MNLLEAWDKAKKEQKIACYKEVITKGACEGTRIDVVANLHNGRRITKEVEYAYITKSIGEYPRSANKTDKEILDDVLFNYMLNLKLETIFSNQWHIVKTKKTGWINIYGNGIIGKIFDTEKKAKSYKNIVGYITTIKIEWEE